MQIWLNTKTNQTIIQTEDKTILDYIDEDTTTDNIEFMFEDGYSNDNIRN